MKVSSIISQIMLFELWLPPSSPVLPPLTDTAQSTAWWLATDGHLVVGDNLDLHQVLQAVVWFVQPTASFSPGWLGRFHRPERDRYLQNTDKFNYSPTGTRHSLKVKDTGSVSPSAASHSAWTPVLRCDWSDQDLAPPPRWAMAPGLKPLELPHPQRHPYILGSKENNRWEVRQVSGYLKNVC